MIGKPEVFSWMRHRAGIERLEEHPLDIIRFSAELNKAGKAFIEAYGKREFFGFVGFVDVVGFSERVKGRSPREVGEFVKPFLSRVIDVAVDRHALVDKTIGDEVMFVMPDPMHDGGGPAHILMGQLLATLRTIQRELGGDYPLRVGLAYGLLFLDRIEGKGYGEWTVSGETVHLAKRIHGLPLLRNPPTIACGFGVLVREAWPHENFDLLVDYVANIPWKVTDEGIANPVSSFKGITPARCTYFLPKTDDELSTWAKEAMGK